MGKLLLHAFAVVSLLVAHGGANEMPKPQITLSPSTIFVGTQVTIHAGPNMSVIVDMDPGGRTRLTTDANGNATYTPSNAGSLFVSDPSGAWSTASDVVLP